MSFRIFFTLLFVTPSFLFGQEDFLKENQNWVKALSTGDKATLSNIYFDNAALFIDYQMVLGKEEIAELLAKNLTKINSFKSTAIVEQDSTHFFQMGNYLVNNEIKYAFVIGWTKKNGTFLKEFETLFSKTITTDKQNINLDEARKKWMDLANTNHPEKLVKNSYTKDSYYFHREKLSKGHQEISERYSYMARPGYKITLSPSEIMLVQENLAFEIGEWKTNGGGKYVLIWQKQKNGKWKTLLDFNF